MKDNLFDVQPSWCRSQLPFKSELYWYGFFKKDITIQERIKKVMFLDPSGIYERVNLKINPFNRYTSVPMPLLFPSQENKTCSCGCGETLTGRQTRWATTECYKYASDIWSIIAGQMPVIDRFLNIYYGDGCDECESDSYEIDHRWPVKFGGGGGWLSNYKKLCKACHREKTNSDFGWKQPKIEDKSQKNLFA